MRTHLIWLSSLLLLGCIGGERRLVDRTQHTLGAEGLDALVFDVGAGRLDVVGDPELESVEVTVELATNLRVFGDDDAAVDALEVTLEEGDGAAQLVVRLEDPPAGYYADVVVGVPARMFVQGEDGSGHACISDVAGVTFDDGSGDISLERISGAVELRDGSGDIDVFGVNGGVDIEDDSGDLRLESVNGNVRVRDGSGDIHVTGVEGGVDVEDGSGDIDLQAIGGDVRIEDGSGDILVDTRGELTIAADGSGDVREL